jgi:hypothetical protein
MQPARYRQDSSPPESSGGCVRLYIYMVSRRRGVVVFDVTSEA